MAFDPQALLALPPLETVHRFTERDTILYALGVGADELVFTYEDGLKALPTMAVVLAYPGFIWRDPRYGVNWQKIVHAEQRTRIHRPLPVKGEVRGETRITAIHDKGAEKGSLALVERKIFDTATGELIAETGMTTFLRGNGGAGGSEGQPPKPVAVPADRPADACVTLQTAPGQAVLYRLSGDLNPLHIDPKVAQAAGFERPILHGLATYGFAGRALLAARCGNDPARLVAMDCRFTAPVYPGEALETEIWDGADGRLHFRTRVPERGVVVLDNGVAEIG